MKDTYIITYFSRLLLSSTATLGLLLSACQGKASDDSNAAAPVITLADDVSKEELVAMMKKAMADAKATKGTGSPAMWTFADEDTTVNIMGTVHLLKPDLVWKSPAITDALAKADTLVLEADVSSPESLAATQKVVMEYAAFPEGESLTGTLNDEDEAIVKAALEARGIPMQNVDQLKPWMIGLQLAIMQMTQAGYDPMSGVETVLMAESGEKKLSYLETAESQIKAIGGAPIEEQVKGLIAQLSTIDLGPEYLDTLVAEWADGDVKGMGGLMANPAIFGSQDAYDALLTTRNRNWIPGIKALLDEPGNKLVAVGAAHLAGPDSVVNMLKDEGIKVKALN